MDWFTSVDDVFVIVDFNLNARKYEIVNVGYVILMKLLKFFQDSQCFIISICEELVELKGDEIECLEETFLLQKTVYFARF